jgi:hypothetical protein
MILVLNLRPGAWVAAAVAGLALAFDGGLLDTARSGSEAYLGALWVGVLLLGRLKGRTRWGPAVAWWAFAMAVMNHPFALCAAPFLLGLPLRSKAGALGMLVGALLLLPHGIFLWQQDLGASGGLSLGVGEALDAWITQGGPMAWVLLFAPVLAIRSSRTRWLGAATLASMLLMALLGLWLGYLRDHHIRLLTVPMAVCLAALPGLWALVPLGFLRLSLAPLPPQGAPPRPGSLGMSTGLVTEIEGLGIQDPLQVDGVWLSGGLVAEPSALLLDLHLRGRPLESLRAGGSLVLLVSADRGQLKREKASGLVSAGNQHWLLHNPNPRALPLCEEGARLGGAWDFFALAHPEDVGGAIMDWMPDCAVFDAADPLQER